MYFRFSLVSTVTELDRGGVIVQFPDGTTNCFLFRSVQMGFQAHLVSRSVRSSVSAAGSKSEWQ